MYISIDIGGTNTRIASFESFKNPKIINKLSWLESHNEKDIKLLISNMHDLTTEIKAIGIGITERISDDVENVEQIHKNHEEYENNICKILEDEFNCPVFLENDAVVASLAVAYFEEKNNIDFIFLTWGTGIGGAKIYYKNNILNYENLDWDKYLKKWEEKCGGRFIKYKYNKTPSELSDEQWNQIIEEFENEFEHFSHKFNNFKFFLGGGIAEKKRNVLVSRIPSLSFTSFGENVGLYGGCALIKNRFENQSL